MKGRLGLLGSMPREYYNEKLTELKIIGNCIRIVTGSSNSCDTSTYIIKKEYLIAIIQNYEGVAFLFKDIYIRIKDYYSFREQISAIIKSELEGVIQASTDLLGINT